MNLSSLYIDFSPTLSTLLILIEATCMVWYFQSSYNLDNQLRMYKDVSYVCVWPLGVTSVEWTIFINILVTPLRTFLLVEETDILWKKHWSMDSSWSKLITSSCIKCTSTVLYCYYINILHSNCYHCHYQ